SLYWKMRKDERAALVVQPVNKGCDGRGTKDVSVEIEKPFEGSLKSPEFAVAVAESSPEALRFGHERHIERMVGAVEPLSGYHHDRDGGTEVTDTGDEGQGKVIVARV